MNEEDLVAANGMVARLKRNQHLMQIGRLATRAGCDENNRIDARLRAWGIELDRHGWDYPDAPAGEVA